MTVLPDVRAGASTPLTEQIARFYRQAIQDGVLRAGERLPTIRAVALHAGVTRATVQQAYRRLAELGLVVATVGRGTTVVEREDKAEALAGPVGRYALDAWVHLRDSAAVTPARPAVVVADFAELRPDPSLFPIDDFRAAVESCLRNAGANLLGYGDPSGTVELRRYLATCPDLLDDCPAGDEGGADPAEILITSGAQQGIDLVVRTLTAPGAAVAAAVPTYHQLFGTLKAFGVRLAPVSCDPGTGAVDLEDLRRVLDRSDVQMLYAMPTFHNPTGRSLDEAQRRAMVQVAVDAGVPILEDEFECELRFRGDLMPSLRSLDSRGWTSTVRSFSKSLFPGARVGWVHAGRALLGPLGAMKCFADLGTSPLVQASLWEFIERGSMQRHLESVRAELADRHAAAQAALGESMPTDVRWTDPDGGFALWIDLPAGVDGELIARRSAERGVLVTPAVVFDPTRLGPDGLRLSLSRTDAETVRRGVRILAECVDESLATETTSSPSLYL